MAFVSVHSQKHKLEEVDQGDKEEYKSSTPAKLINLYECSGLII